MSTRGEFKRQMSKLLSLLNEREEKQRWFLGIQGDGSGTVDVSGAPGYVYVRDANNRGVVHRVLNVLYSHRNDLPVIVGYTPWLPNTPQVLAADFAALGMETGGYAYIASHADSHELHNESGGDDVVWIDMMQITDGQVVGKSTPDLTVDVRSCSYAYGDELYWFPGEDDVDLSGSVPGANLARWVLVSIDTTADPHEVQLTDGDTYPKNLFPGGLANLNTTVPTPPSGCIPLALVFLEDTTTEIYLQGDGRNIYDARLFPTGISGVATPTDHADRHEDGGDDELDGSNIPFPDTGADHDLFIDYGEDASADRTLTVVLNDADRSVTVEEDVVLNDNALRLTWLGW